MEHKNKTSRDHLKEIKNLQAKHFGATYYQQGQKPKVTLPTFSWEKKDGRDLVSTETQDQNKLTTG